MSVELSENCSNAACWCRSADAGEIDGVALTGAAVLALLTAVLERQSAFRFTARGYSMAPLIRDGDVLTIAPLAGYIPGIGDVVAARHPAAERLLIHRIVRTTPDGVVLRGDNNLQADGCIPCTHLLGTVTRVERQGRQLPWPRPGPGMRRQHGYVNGCLRPLRGAWGGLWALGVGLFGLLQRMPGYRACLRPVLMPADRLTTRVEVLATLPEAGRPDPDGPPSRWLSAVCRWRLSVCVGEQIAGTVTLQRCPAVGWWLTELAVRVRYRELGVEDALLAQVEQTLHAGGMDGVGALPLGAAQQTCYQRHGYGEEQRALNGCTDACPRAAAPIRLWKTLTKDVA